MSREGLAEVIKALRVTAEMCGSQYSDDAARMFVADLSMYPVDQVLGALRRCRREVKGRLTVADVINRLADGRPGPEEAWAMLPTTESQTVVWSDEMRRAWAVAQPLLDAGERVAARMAFKETYVNLVSQARENAVPVRWEPTLGTDPHQRADALQAAVDKGLLQLTAAAAICPELATRSMPQIAPPDVQRNAAMLRDLAAVMTKFPGAERMTPEALQAARVPAEKPTG